VRTGMSNNEVTCAIPESRVSELIDRLRAARAADNAWRHMPQRIPGGLLIGNEGRAFFSSAPGEDVAPSVGSHTGGALPSQR
jgi:hypothetical protein